jgi:FkbM family methyltransferase
MCPLPESELASCLPHRSEPPAFHAQHWEDRHLLKNFFCNAYNKTFLEIGGFDGDKYSNTKFLEDTMGWSGIIIEAQPESASQLQRNRGGNPKNHIFSSGVCSPEFGKNGSLTFWGRAESTAGVPDLQSDEFRDTWHTEPGDQVKYEVPCDTISSMLQQAKTTHLALFSLDVEGAELMGLETMDWDVSVCVWLVEMDGTNEKKDEAVGRMLTQHGYRRSGVRFWEEDRSDGYSGGGDNVAFVHPDLEECLKK